MSRSHLVIGAGEVGQALHRVITGSHIRDVEDQHNLLPVYDVLHITVPWQIPNFVATVHEYAGEYDPEFVIVHSTVPIGTCDDNGWVHSPIRGKHPDLEAGIRTFAKHYGGDRAATVADVMSEYLPYWYAHPKAAITEAAKLVELWQYGMEIMMEKEIHQLCKEFDLPHHVVYSLFGETYNDGWAELGHPEYQKPILKHMEGPIGGHCVIAGTKILEQQYDAVFVRGLLGLNRMLELEQERAAVDALKKELNERG